MLDLRSLAPFADYFVIMSAESSRQIQALEEDITKSLKDAGVSRHRREGSTAGGWVLLDFSDVIVHIRYCPTCRKRSPLPQGPVCWGRSGRRQQDTRWAEGPPSPRHQEFPISS